MIRMKKSKYKLEIFFFGKSIDKEWLTNIKIITEEIEWTDALRNEKKTHFTQRPVMKEKTEEVVEPSVEYCSFKPIPTISQPGTTFLKIKYS